MADNPWELGRFVETFASAQGLEDQVNVLKDAILSYGYDTYAFGIVPNARPDHTRDVIMISNYDPRFSEEYVERNYGPHDNVITHCLLHNSPILWSRFHLPDEKALLTPEEALVIERSTAWGYHVGVTIPLWVPNSLTRYGISLTKAGLMDFEPHDSLFLEHRHTLTTIAKLFLLGADLSEEIYRHYGLSETDRHIIALLANGRKLKEIAFELRRERARRTGRGAMQVISESALHQRITRMWKKVGVKNTSQLVANFSRLGITPMHEESREE